MIVTVVLPFAIDTVVAIGVVGAAAVTTATEDAVTVVGSIAWAESNLGCDRNRCACDRTAYDIRNVRNGVTALSRPWW